MRKGQKHSPESKKKMKAAQLKHVGPKGMTNADYVAAYEEHGSVQATAKALGVNRSTVQYALKAAGIVTDRTKLFGELGGFKVNKFDLPAKGKVARYIVSCAQNDTKVNTVFFNRLLELAEFYDAAVLVAPFTYSPNTSLTKVDEPGYDPLLNEYIISDRVQLAPGLVFCGEITRILPTAARPLSGFEGYTGRASGIFPHPKIAMEAIPSMPNEPTKFNYTTGCVTKHNYSRTKAGFKGEFHHAFGALIVEVESDGGWYVRQINADSQNRIYDLDICVDEDGVTFDNPIHSLIPGDVHVAEIDPAVLKATWGRETLNPGEPLSLIDFLRPEEQILHDLFDMRARPWQEQKDFHRNYAKHLRGQDSVSDELDECAEVIIGDILRDNVRTTVVRSNHDVKLESWLNNIDAIKNDPVNAEFFFEANLEKIRATRAENDRFMVLEWALKKRGVPDDVAFLAYGDSYVICKNKGGGIECANHGHAGANGAKGTPRGFAKMARKQWTADIHSPGIVDGVYTVGVCTGGTGTTDKKGPGYTQNGGLSSWSPTHGITYENGKRALLTMWNGKFFASRDELEFEK